METSGCGAGQWEAWFSAAAGFGTGLSSASQQDLRRQMFEGEWLPEEGGERGQGVSRMWLNGGKWPAAEEGEHPGGPHLRADRSLTRCHRRAKWELQRKCAGLSLPGPIHLLSPPTGTPCLHRLSIVGTNLIYKQKATYNTFYSFWTIEKSPWPSFTFEDGHTCSYSTVLPRVYQAFFRKQGWTYFFVCVKPDVAHNNLFRRLLLLSRGPMVRTRGRAGSPGCWPGPRCPNPELLHVVAACSGPLGLLVSHHGDPPAHCGGFSRLGRCVGQATFLPSPSSELWPCPCEGTPS